ncbi:MAG: OmpH family outer membrane protein [Candidatus Baltobacteraceae bacterium]
MRSSKFAAWAAAGSIALLAGCNHAVDVNSPQVRGIGYVHLDDVVKVHPLYPQLSQIDSTVAAIDLQSLGPAVPQTGQQISQETSQLNVELKAAQDRTNRILAQKQLEYQQREQAAIAAAIAASGESGGGSAASAMQSVSAQQAQTVSAQANGDFATYQQSVIAQNNAALKAISKALFDRANARYAQKLNQLNQSESQLALELSTADASQRLSIRTKLSNLAMDDATRKSYKDQLATLNRRESDAVAAARNRDQAELATFQTQLRVQTQNEVNAQAAKINSQTQAKIALRHSTVSSQVTSALRGLGPAPSGGGYSASTKAKIAQLDKQFKSEFQADAQKSIAEYQQTKSDLDQRFAQLHGIDSAATGSAAKQLAKLQAQRQQLYGQIVAQIQREANTIAAQRGLKVVFVNVVVAVGGVDLTPEVEKDVESLHE